MVLLCFGMQAAVAPSPAKAFVGESLVIGGAELTKEAENLVEVPDFIPKVWEGGGGFPPVEEKNAWTAFWEDNGFLRVGGSAAAAFGLGTVIGSAICNNVLELEGCWYFSNEAADPAVTGGNWVFHEKTLELGEGVVPGGRWYWQPTSSSDNFHSYRKQGGAPACAFFGPPTGTQSGFLVGTGIVKALCESKEWSFNDTYPYRYLSTNRTLKGETKAEAAGQEQLHYNPPENWKKRAAECLQGKVNCGLTKTQLEHVGQHIASATPKGIEAGIKDPYAGYVKVPACGSTWSPCKEAIEELKLVPVRESLDWKTAVIEKGAGAVLKVSPSSGAEVKVGSKVFVETNPDSEGMPAVVPEPEEHETYAHYIARLAPSLDPTREVVSDANEDTSAGPDAVLQVSPEPGTRSDPAVTTAVEVQTNPHDAPPVPIGGGSCDASVGSLDLSPLNQPVGEKFPFGVVPFFIDWIGEWSSTGIPKWTITLIPEGVFGSDGISFPVNMAFFDDWAEGIRIAFILASFLGMLWFLGTAFLNLRGDDS